MTDHDGTLITGPRDDSDPAFEVHASALADLLAATIPLASTDITLPSISCVMLRRQGDYLTATATDRFVVGIARARLAEDLPAPESGWSFPLKLTDAKGLLKLARELARGKRRGKLARVRLVDDGLGVLRLPHFDLSFIEVGVDGGLLPGGFPPVHKLLANGFGRLRSAPSGVSGLDPRKVAQFAPAAKLARERCESVMEWWQTDERWWALRIGKDFIGLVMGIRLPVEQHEADLVPAATLADWSEVLR